MTGKIYLSSEFNVGPSPLLNNRPNIKSGSIDL